ncbi:hypothetical protein D6833_13030, partial [Candidatus Parcubacteria bacterium]
TCPDKDHDSIPNLAERWDLGLNMDLESTDHDKFDDGQELFGVTDCPGGDLSCGYGDLPRSSDAGYVGATMPAWVKAPGNHPLVAAFPVPEVDVVESSFHVQTVTTVTTDHTITKGTETTYSTAKTEGTSSSEAQTETWEEWQEVSKTNSAVSMTWEFVPNNAAQGKQLQLFKTKTSLSTMIKQFVKTDVAGYAADKLTDVADFVLDQACAEVACKKKAGAAVRTAVRAVLSMPDIVQRSILSNECAKDIWGKVVCAAKATGALIKDTYRDRLEAVTVADQERRGQVGGQLLTDPGDGTLLVQRVYPITYNEPHFVPTETQTKGTSRGGAHTTTHTQYEQHTITNGQAFSSQQAWSTATAVDSAHAADLWFTYVISNTGTEYAREIANLAFNIY